MSELRDLYQEVILDHYRHPRHHGRVEDASNEADGFNPLCGDRIHMTIKPDGEKVEEIAISKGCCKLTLEVLSGNAVAKASYEKFGFSGYELDPKVGNALFWQKSLNT